MGDNQVQNLILFPMIVGWATGPSDVENRAAWWGSKGGLRWRWNVLHR